MKLSGIPREDASKDAMKRIVEIKTNTFGEGLLRPQSLSGPYAPGGPSSLVGQAISAPLDALL